MLADAAEWRHDPWSGESADGFLWGRGALDMKSQVAAEAVAAAAWPGRAGGPAAGALKLVFVADEETGGDVGAHWLTEHHPDKVRCDLLLNEGGGEVFQYGGAPPLRGVLRREGRSSASTLTARGTAGHASLPRTGDNALLKLGPGADRARVASPVLRRHRRPAGLLRGLGEDPDDPWPRWRGSRPTSRGCARCSSRCSA